MSDLELAIQESIDDRLLDVHTCFPARVVSYVAAAQQARLRPASWTEGFPLPELLDIPVLQPRAGAGALHMPVTAGDWVLVVCAETSLERWRAAQSEGAEKDPQRHSLNGALALALGSIAPIAGLNSTAVTILGTEIRLGDVSPTDAASRASLVLTELNRVKADLMALKAALTTAFGAVLPAPGPGPQPPITAWLPSSPSSVASDVVLLD